MFFKLIYLYINIDINQNHYHMLHSIFYFYFISGTGEKYENDSFVAISERKSNFVNDNKPLQQYFYYFL